MRNTKLMSMLAFSVIAGVFFAAIFTGCGQQKTKIEKFKASFIQAYEDAYNRGEVNALEKILAADFVFHSSSEPDIKGLNAYKQYIADARHVRPDMHLIIDSVIMEENTSAMRWTFQFTDMPTGKLVKITGCTMYQWENGKAVECWNYPDKLGYLQQVGYKMMPPIT